MDLNLPEPTVFFLINGDAYQPAKRNGSEIGHAYRDESRPVVFNTQDEHPAVAALTKKGQVVPEQHELTLYTIHGYGNICISSSD